MLLYIVRHAWAGEADEVRWPDDRQRPLTKDGTARFRKVARTLAARGCQPELIATSPLVRCRQTAELLAQAMLAPPDVVDLAALQPGSDLDALIEWSNRQRAQSLAWVGHGPDVNELVLALLGADRAEMRFTKGATCCLEFADSLERGVGILHWHATAKILGC